MQGSNRFILGVIIHAAIIAAAIVYAGKSSTPAFVDYAAPSQKMESRQMADIPSVNNADYSKVAALGDNDHVYGSREARIQVITYVDMQCSFCARFHPVAKEMVDRSKGEVNFIVRYFPLGNNPDAEKWAAAAECVAKQKSDNGFFAFLDAIFQVRGGLNDDSVSEISSSLGVDKNAYNECMQSPETRNRIRLNVAEADAIGVQGTPSMLVRDSKDGRSIFKVGAMPLEELACVIAQLK